MKLTVQHLEGFRFRVTCGEHTLWVDAALEDGGAGTAMSTPQLFAAAVGACMLSFVVNSCTLHGTPVERLALEMEFEEAGRPRRVSRMEARIRLSPNVDENRQRALIGMARHSTLMNTLARPPEITIAFAAESGDEETS